MYRAVTVKALRHALDLSDPLVVRELADSTTVELRHEGGNPFRVLLDQEDVTEEIRDPKISQNVSQVAMIPSIRKMLVKTQQAMAKEGGVVMEGRDIGTVVLPDAQIKVFLTATADERAERRRTELATKGFRIAQEEMRREIIERDAKDSGREIDPLIQAADAYVIDCSAINAQEVAELIIGRVEAES